MSHLYLNFVHVKYASHFNYVSYFIYLCFVILFVVSYVAFNYCSFNYSFIFLNIVSLVFISYLDPFCSFYFYFLMSLRPTFVGPMSAHLNPFLQAQDSPRRWPKGGLKRQAGPMHFKPNSSKPIARPKVHFWPLDCMQWPLLLHPFPHSQGGPRPCKSNHSWFLLTHGSHAFSLHEHKPRPFMPSSTASYSSMASLLCFSNRPRTSLHPAASPCSLMVSSLSHA